ncbi:MAG: flagellar hook-basal body complex protein FliE [Alphaproteobacteria bacterium]|nr:flagellar hook-basal body complex protein FliE [Alphaproteobacteria bacterium]
MANMTAATAAYSSALNQLRSASAAVDPAESSGSAFGDLLKQSLQNTVESQHRSEKVSAAALSGKADMTDVLQALTNAEMALNTVLAVRDKVVQAYEQVMRTPM